MKHSIAWVQQGLLILATVAILLGAVELLLLSRGKRRSVPGYGWETEVTHLVMNVVMATMMTVLWSETSAKISALGLCAAALLLAVVSAVRPSKPNERGLIATAAVIHVCSALLMAWLAVRMAPSPEHMMAMPAGHAGRPWFYWLAAAFYIFDLVSIVIITSFRNRVPEHLRSNTPRLSLVPHAAMDIGMVAMLALI